MANKGVSKHGIIVRLACVVYGISDSCFCYQAPLDGDNPLVAADWLLKLSQTHKRWAFGLCFLYLRIKPRRRIKQDYPGELPVPTAPNQVRSMDFMSDQLASGKTFRTCNVLDDYNREGLCEASPQHFAVTTDRST